MSWISVLLLAAGAIAAHVPYSGNHNQIQGNYQGGDQEGSNQQYPSQFGNYEDSGVFGKNYGRHQNSENSQQNVPDRYTIKARQNRDESLNRNVGQDYQNVQGGNPSSYNSNSGFNSNSGYNSQNQGLNQGSYGNPNKYEQNEYKHAQYSENKRNAQPGVGVYGQGGYVSDNQNNDESQNYGINRYSGRVTPVPAKVGSINDEYGLSDLDEETLQQFQNFVEPVLALYTRNSPNPEKYQLKDASQILKSKNFDNNKKTLVYIHGFTEGLFSDSVKNVIAMYSDENGHNIIILDWHWQASPPYFLKAVPNVEKVGVRTGVALLDMINSGLNLERLHIVGHSLGGQMAGVIGRTIQKESRGGVILRRISALDPAYPGFYGIPNAKHLTERDAEYVDVVHTNAGVYGAPVSTGTVDFWPNSGLAPQPGCRNNHCSHQRSWWYWIGSLTNNSANHFNAIKANSWKDFVSGKVGEVVPDIKMGVSCPTGLYGNYYLQTNDVTPFGKGENGISFTEAFLAAILPPTPLLNSEPSVEL